MSERFYRYPWRELRGDYLRAGAGLVLTLVPMVAAWGNVIGMAVLASLASLFGIFGVRTALKHRSRYRIDDEGIARLGPSTAAAPSATVRWGDVDRVKLAFYSTKRDRSYGWMHLTIRGGGNRLGLDSVVEGFDDIAARAAEAAAANRVRLSDTTVRNFAALGLVISLEDGQAVRVSKGGFG
jgi:hypothetical protein